MKVAQTTWDLQGLSGGHLFLGLGTQVWVRCLTMARFRATIGTDHWCPETGGLAREAREEAEAGVATTKDRDYVGFVLRTQRLMAV